MDAYIGLKGIKKWLKEGILKIMLLPPSSRKNSETVGSPKQYRGAAKT